MKAKIFQFFLFLFVVFLPIQLGKHFWPSWSFVRGVRVDYLSPTFYLEDGLLLLLVLFELLFLRGKNYSLRKFTPIIGIVSAIGIFLFFRSGPGLLRFVRILEVVATIIIVRCHASKQSLIALGLGVAIFWSSLLGLAQFSLESSVGNFWYFLGERTFTSNTPGIALAHYPSILGSYHLHLRPYATFSHPNSLAGFILISLLLIQSFSSPFLRLAKILGIVTLFLSASKGVVGVGILVLLFNLLKGSLSSKQTFLRLSIIFIGSIFVYSLFIKDRSSTLNRALLLRNSFYIISQHPFTGVGLGNYIPSQAKLITDYRLSTSSEVTLQPVHNILLLTAAEVGIPTALVILFFIYRFILKLLQFRLYDEIIILISVIATGMLDHYWITLPQNLLLLGVLLGILWSRSDKSATITTKLHDSISLSHHKHSRSIHQ